MSYFSYLVEHFKLWYLRRPHGVKGGLLPQSPRAYYRDLKMRAEFIRAAQKAASRRAQSNKDKYLHKTKGNQ